MKKITVNTLRETILNKFKEMGCEQVMDANNPDRVDYVVATREQALQVKDFILANCVSSIKGQIAWRSVQDRDFEKKVSWSGMYHTYIGTFTRNVSIRVR